MRSKTPLANSADHYALSAVAQLCNVHRSALNRWIERGWLHVFRTPGGRLRVSHVELVRFLNTYGYPVPAHLLQAPTAIPANDTEDPCQAS